VGGTSMSTYGPSSNILRAISTGTASGDGGIGNANSGGVLGNGGSNADGIAVFTSPVAGITSSTVPVDAIFYGSGIGGALVSAGTAGYQLPVNDLYPGGKLQSTSFFGPDPAPGQYIFATGSYDVQTGSFTTPRTWNTSASFTNLASSVLLQGLYNFSWSNSSTTQNISGLSAGTYTYTISDNSPCPATGTITITEPPVLAVSVATQTDVSCNGANDGMVTVNATGGTPAYAYFWSPSGGTAAASDPLAPGSYTCTVTDSHACTSNASVTITEPAALTVSASSQTDVGCNGGNNGDASVTASGGTAPYMYSWSSGGTSATESGLAAGTYSCIITDAHACTVTQTFSITEPSALAVTNTTQNDAGCFGGNDGDASVTVSGGSAPYTYAWSSGGTAATESGLAAGTYSCVITDSHSCTVTQTFVIAEPVALSCTATLVNVSCNGGSNGSANVTPAGGTGPYTYAWSSGGTSATESGLSAGTYSCVITDSHSCTLTQTVGITEPAALSATATQNNVSCNGGNNGTATVSVSGGTASYSYAWSSGGTAATESGLAMGTYTCTITDANTCTATATVNITEPSALSVTTTQTDVTCNGGNNGTATVSVSGGTASYSYAWSSGGTAATESGLAMGTYTCNITDANSCTTSATVNITEPAAIVFSLGPDTMVCSPVTVNFCAPGGFASYLWNDNSTAQCLNAGTSGCYSVLATDANGCQSSDTICLTVNTCTGIDEAAIQGFDLFPNPNNGRFTIVLGSNQTQATLDIFDGAGQLIGSRIIHQDEEIDLSGYAKGFYFARINGETRKLIIQ
ncbi:MAG TPA: T9SS type A sorting domain-containing protein, partial [Bacteroidia bacterium]|nr:T9SS type A sorting domain-containing protein [Bacteroidia bacterium]